MLIEEAYDLLANPGANLVVPSPNFQNVCQTVHALAFFVLIYRFIVTDA